MKIKSGITASLRIVGLHAQQTPESFLVKLNRDFEQLNVKANLHGDHEMIIHIPGGTIKENLNSRLDGMFYNLKCEWDLHYGHIREAKITEDMYVSQLMALALRRFGWSLGELVKSESIDVA
jgi:hypothetical protein